MRLCSVHVDIIDTCNSATLVAKVDFCPGRNSRVVDHHKCLVVAQRRTRVVIEAHGVVRVLGILLEREDLLRCSVIADAVAMVERVCHVVILIIEEILHDVLDHRAIAIVSITLSGIEEDAFQQGRALIGLVAHHRYDSVLAGIGVLRLYDDRQSCRYHVGDLVESDVAVGPLLPVTIVSCFCFA